MHNLLRECLQKYYFFLSDKLLGVVLVDGIETRPEGPRK